DENAKPKASRASIQSMFNRGSSRNRMARQATYMAPGSAFRQPALDLLVSIARETSGLEELVAEFRSKAERNTDYMPAQTDLLYVCQSAGKTDEAIVVVEHMRTLLPDDEQLAVTAANMYQGANRLDEAIAIYESLAASEAPS